MGDRSGGDCVERVALELMGFVLAQNKVKGESLSERQALELYSRCLRTVRGGDVGSIYAPSSEKAELKR